MPTIKQLQQDFAKGVLNKNDITLIQQIRRNAITPEFRFNIYRTTILQNLRNALEITFPAIWQLVGKDCADNLALAFAQEKTNLPNTNCLDDWGAKFPIFLSNFQPIAHLVYLKDMAEIEWLKHLSYCAADDKVLDSRKLKKLEQSIEKLHVVFNSSVFLYTSSYHLKNIFDLLNNPDASEKIDLLQKQSYAVIVRQQGNVQIHWIAADLFAFLNQLKEGHTLLQAYENTLHTYPQFELVPALQFILNHQLICRIID